MMPTDPAAYFPGLPLRLGGPECPDCEHPEHVGACSAPSIGSEGGCDCDTADREPGHTDDEEDAPMTTEAVLTHDLDGDPFTCFGCATDASARGNAHSLYDALTVAHDATTTEADVVSWLAIVAERARVAVAEVSDGDLVCWCGHSLHYPDCACDDGLPCAKRYAVELAVHTEDDARARFVCSGETMEHWPESIERAEDGDWLVGCGACGAEVWVRGARPEPDPDDRPGDHGGDDPGYRSAMQDAGRGSLLR